MELNQFDHIHIDSSLRIYLFIYLMFASDVDFEEDPFKFSNLFVAMDF